MKTIFKIIGGGLIAFIGLIIGIALFATSGVADTADDFFDAVKSDQHAEAYSLLSEEFKSGTNQDQLKSFLKQSGLNDVEDYSFGSRSVKNGRGKIVTSITTGAGAEFSVTFEFIKRNDEWQIYSLRKETSEHGQKPSEQEQVKLTKGAMHAFTVSVRDQDMTGMFNHVSIFWQKQYSIENFNETFGSFFQFGNKLMVLDQLTPEFSQEARLDDDGFLTFKGTFPTTPDKVYFEQKFVYEGLGWKLIGFNIEIK